MRSQETGLILLTAELRGQALIARHLGVSANYFRREDGMVGDQLEQILTSLAVATTLLTFVSFVSLLAFSLFKGLLRRRAGFRL